MFPAISYIFIFLLVLQYIDCSRGLNSQDVAAALMARDLDQEQAGMFVI